MFLAFIFRGFDIWYRSSGADGLVLSDASVSEAVTAQLGATLDVVTGSSQIWQ